MEDQSNPFEIPEKTLKAAELVPELTKDNYHSWATNMNLVLRKADLWQYVQPESSNSEDLPSADVERWAEVAADVMNLRISTEVGYNLTPQDFLDGRLLWKRLDEMLVPRGLAAFMSRKKALRIGALPGESTSVWGARRAKLEEELQHTGVKLTSDLKFVVYLDKTLPRKYDKLKAQWWGMKQDDLTREKVTAMMETFDVECRRKAHLARMKQSACYYRRTRGGRRGIPIAV